MDSKNELAAMPTFKIFPTYTSSIIKMDNSYDPRFTLGLLQGDKDIVGLDNFNLENKMRVLTSMDELLANQIPNLTSDQVSFHFSTLANRLNSNANEIIQLSTKFSQHKAKQTEKLKNKLTPGMPMPTPSDTGLNKKQKDELERKAKHELAQKKSYQNTPFKLTKNN
jgi:hypothetical protein